MELSKNSNFNIGLGKLFDSFNLMTIMLNEISIRIKMAIITTFAIFNDSLILYTKDIAKISVKGTYKIYGYIYKNIDIEVKNIDWVFLAVYF